MKQSIRIEEKNKNYFSLNKIMRHFSAYPEATKFLKNSFDDLKKSNVIYFKKNNNQEERVSLFFNSSVTKEPIGVLKEWFSLFLMKNKEEFIKFGCSRKEIALLMTLDEEDETVTNLISLDQLALRIAPKSFKNQIISFIEEKCLTDLFLKEDAILGKQIKPMFVSKSINAKKQVFYLRLDAYDKFMAVYQNKILDMLKKRKNETYITEVQKYAGLSLYNPEKEEYIYLWDLAKKFCSNSSCCNDFANYIEENFLNLTYQDDEGKETSVFVCRHLKNGVVRYYFKKKALPFFKENFASVLKEKAIELEKQSEVVDLRTFVRMMSKNKPHAEKNLREFIKEKCLSDYITVVDENGKQRKIFIFEQPVRNYIYIYRQAIPFFVEKYKNELKNIGFVSLDMDIKERKKLSKDENFMPVLALSSYLGIPKKEFEAFRDFVLSVKNDQNKKVDSFFHETSMNLYIRKEKITDFINKFKNDLFKFSVDDSYLSFLLGEQVCRRKTAEMISIRNFLKLFKIPQYKKIVDLFYDEFLTKEEKVLIDGKEEFVFEQAFYNAKKKYYFKNDQVMKVFIQKNKETLITKFNISPIRLNFILTGKKLQLLDDNVILIRDLSGVLHKRDFITLENLKLFMNDTYPSKNEKGDIVQKPMIHVCLSPKCARQLYVMDRDAIKYFALKYKEKFQISTTVIEALWGKKDVILRHNDYMGLYSFCYILGKNPNSRLGNQNKLFVDKVYDLIEKKYQNATFDFCVESEFKQKMPLFKEVFSKNGKRSWQINFSGVVDFIKMAEKDLISIGFNKERLIFSFSEFNEKLKHYKENATRDYLKHKQKLLNKEKQRS